MLLCVALCLPAVPLVWCPLLLLRLLLPLLLLLLLLVPACLLLDLLRMLAAECRCAVLVPPSLPSTVPSSVSSCQWKLYCQPGPL